MLDAQRPLAHTQVMRSATTVATPAVAFAATARAPLPTAQQQQKAQQSITKPTARALSASMHAPKGNHGDGAYLHASFQIGSTHGRVSFGADERVFHRSDVPPAARQAVEEVTALLRTGLLQRDGRPWNSSTTSGVAIRGSKCCSWETPADRFDDRYYHKLESETRVQAAKRRVDAIRCGHDPDWDPRNQNPRWNVSTLPEEQVVTALSATKIDQQQQLQSPSNSQFLPEDYKSLLQQQRNLSLHYRAERATAAEQQAERAALAESWASFARAAHVNGPPTQPQLERAAPVEAQIQEAAAGVARQYPPDVLTTFLWQQENPEAAAAAGLKPLDPAPGTQQSDRSGPVASRYALPSTVHHDHRHDRSVAVQQSVPYSSKLPPAWYRAEARTKQLAKSTQEAPFPKFQHPSARTHRLPSHARNSWMQASAAD